MLETQASDPSAQGPVEGREEEPVEVLGAVQPEEQTQVQQGQQGTRKEEEEKQCPVQNT